MGLETPGTGNCVFVTGTSSGIGQDAARELHRRGWRVFAGARGSADLDRLRSQGLEPVRLDLADEASVDSAAAQVLERSAGRINGLVNNAAYGQPGAVEDLDRHALREQFETNLFGTHQLTARLLPAMREAGHGRVVQISSVLGLVALPWRGAYNASKFALEALSDTLRLELVGSGIHVSLVEPGPIESRFRSNALAALRRHVDTEASPHREAYRGIVARLESTDNARFTLPASAVTRCVIHALESDRPRIRYRVTVPTHLLAVLRRALPGRLLDAFILRVSRSEHRRR